MKYIKEFIKYKEYKGEKAIYRVNDNCGNTYYSDEYVNWLEEQLHIHDVSGECEHDWCLGSRQGVDYIKCFKCEDTYYK